jgi:UDP-N-acetylmuramyl pentapeptide phosphotransferase/UDP-N-acetylglucosamine-1-phosphate transferase
LHQHYTGDSDNLKPQRFHSDNIPRVGGLSIFLGIAIATFYRFILQVDGWYEILLILISSLPAFIVGIGEDLTKKFSIRLRLMGTLFSALLACYLFDSWINRVDIPFLNTLLLIPLISVVFSCIAISGLSNSYNFIDGFNGLASVVGIITLSSICYVSFKNNDLVLILLSSLMIGALLGFIFWNYPSGKIFLGDGGAYLIGFWIGFLSILLVSRNPNVSPWYAVLVNIYPLFETVFTIYRRTFYHKKNPAHADSMHLHSLIYRRVVYWPNSEKGTTVSAVANAKTSPYLWLICSLGGLPASIAWGNTKWLICFCVIFCFFYVWVYRMIVKFKVPDWVR